MASSVWYRAGTISIPANSKIVKGTNTKWSDSKQGIGAGQMLLIPGAGTVQMYEIASVDSDTQITLNDALVGAAISSSNYAIPVGIVGVKDTLVLQTVARLSYYQSQMDGWQQIMTGTGNITLVAPDGTSVTISSFKKLTDDMAGKAAKGANTDITSLSNISGGIAFKRGGSLSYENPSNASQQLGFLNYDYANGTLLLGNSFTPVKIKASSTVQFRTTDAAVSNTVNPAWVSLSAGNIVANAFVQTSGGLMYGGQLTSSLQINGSGARSAIMQYYLNSGVDENILFTLLIGGTSTNFRLNNAGYGVAPAGWITSSDSRIKDKKTVIDDPWTKMRGMRGYTWTRLDTGAEGVGFLAQEVQSIFPDNVMNLGETTLKDGTVVKDTLAPDTIGVAAGLHHEAILALMDKVEALESAVQARDAALEEIQKRLKALDGLDA